MPNDIDRIEQRDRLRDEPAPHDTIIVVRGGPDTVTKILQHTCRTQQRWALDGKPLTGVSVFCVLDSEGPASLDGLLAGRMRSYRVVHQAPVGKLLSAGFELLPTAGCGEAPCRARAVTGHSAPPVQRPASRG